MTKEEFEKLVSLHEDLENNICRISRAYAEAYAKLPCPEFEDFRYADTLIEIDDGGVRCQGYGPCHYGECDKYGAYYSKEFLLMSDDELKQYVDWEIEKHKKELQEKEDARKKRERNEMEKEYERLKRVLGK